MKTFDGLELFTHSWLAKDCKADVILVHGFFEHCLRYEVEANTLNQAGFSVHTYDQRTHGRSGGKRRSYVNNFQDYSQDYNDFLTSLDLGSQRPYFLFSHSMGGLVQTTYLIEHKITDKLFKGAIFSAPLLLPDKDTSPLLQKFSAVIGTLFPTLKLIKIDAGAISRDPEEVKKYKEDPLIYTDKLYAASGYNLLKQMKKIRPLLPQINCPILVMYGTDDKLAEPAGSKLLFDQVSSTDKDILEFKGFKHEITRDIGKEKVLSHMIKWMNDRI